MPPVVAAGGWSPLPPSCELDLTLAELDLTLDELDVLLATPDLTLADLALTPADLQLLDTSSSSSGSPGAASAPGVQRRTKLSRRREVTLDDDAHRQDAARKRQARERWEELAVNNAQRVRETSPDELPALVVELRDARVLGVEIMKRMRKYYPDEHGRIAPFLV